MKKILILMTISLLAIGSVSAQTTGDYDLSVIEDSFESFADGVANALPAATNMGLNWNDAYVGSFPHMGIGLTVGAVMLPIDAFEDVYDMTGEGGIDEFSDVGIPLPVYTADFRMGIPLIPLPMDLGFKFGTLNSSMLEIEELEMEYLMVGGDIRWAIWEDRKLKGFRPDLSVGVGYTYLKGNITVPIDDQVVDVSDSIIYNNMNIRDTEMYFDWGSSVLDLKAQVSKQILILNLSAGAGFSYGWSHAGGGITGSTVDVDGQEVDSSIISTLGDLAGVDIDTDGVTVESNVSGGSFRFFGGAGLNLWLLKIDLGLLYAVPSNTLGGSVNVRLQY